MVAGFDARVHAPLIQRRAAAAVWAALGLFIIYGSSGAVGVAGPRSVALPGLSWPDIAQNFLLYVPFGTFGVWALRRDTGIGPALIARVTAIALFFALAVEMLQTLLASRIASPLDVMSNVAGAAAGAAVAARVEHAGRIAIRAIGPTGLFVAPRRYLLAALFAAIVIAAWYPFDVTLDVSTLSERTRAVRRDPWLPQATTELWLQGGRFFFLAALLTGCLPGLSRKAAPIAAAVSVSAAMAVDLGQLAMGSHPIGLSSFVAQAAGACAGAAAAFALVLARGRRYAAA